MLSDFRQCYKYRELFYVWTLREIQVRYKQSVLGAAWAVLQPLSLMVVFSVIFSIFVKVPTGNIPYPVFSYTALLPWTFLTVSISSSVSSLTQNVELVTKVYFPREILPCAVVASSLVDFMIGAVIFVAMLALYHVSASTTFLFLPVLLALQVVLMLGVALIASAVNVFYRDVRFVIPLVLQLWMYATPIIYPLSLVPERYRALYMMNPMADLIESYRAVTLNGQLPDLTYFVSAAIMSLLIFILGYRYFKQVEWKFADII